jgi:hypothetical protein
MSSPSICQAAALGYLVRRRIRAREERDFFHYGGRADIEFKQPIYLFYSITEFLLDLLDYSPHRLLAVELAGTGLYGTLDAILQIDRQPKLPRQQNGVSIGIIGQSDSRIAVIIDFPRALLPGTVAPSLLECDAHQLAPISGGRLDVLDTYTRVISLHIAQRRWRP